MYSTINRLRHFNIWIFSGSVLWSLCWLIPNHNRPWLSFHADALASFVILFGAACVLKKIKTDYCWGNSLWVLLGLVALIWVQFGMGLVHNRGTASVGTIFLLGLILAILVAQKCEVIAPLKLADAMFVAIGIAAIVSVSLQINQCLNPYDDSIIWAMAGSSNRPYANLGQPNQLATLLLWGLLSVVWACVRRCISGWAALLAACYLLLGVALTGSRAAWLGVLVIMAGVIFWRRKWSIKNLVPAAMALGLYFVACLVAWGTFERAVQFATDAGAGSDGSQGEPRAIAWQVLLDAASHKPWFGFGWGQTMLAQLEVGKNYAQMHEIFSYSHNLFLDFLIWFGVPVGLGLALLLILWVVRRVRAVQTEHDAVLLLLILVVGNHAMFEMPLYYAYFLLPTGIAVGLLEARMPSGKWFALKSQFVMAYWALMALALVILVSDYFKVEERYNLIRLERMRIVVPIPSEPPKILLLTQWLEYFHSARIDPEKGLGEAQKVGVLNAIVLYPDPGLFLKLSLAEGLDGNTIAAKKWLANLCILYQNQCANANANWARAAARNPEVTNIQWP